MSKIAYKVTEQVSGKEFVVKEIRFRDEFVTTHDDAFEDERTNNTLSSKQGFYELDTIKAIAKSRIDCFPQNYGLFCYVHPVHDSYTDREIEKGRVVSIPVAKKLRKEGYGVSLFIAEELIKGRLPNEDQLAQAKAMRVSGMNKHPRIWLTVDIDSDDIIVDGHGALKFIDVGNFKDLNAGESRMLKEFMIQDRKKS